jgi:hypothetical protein
LTHPCLYFLSSFLHFCCMILLFLFHVQLVVESDGPSGSGVPSLSALLSLLCSLCVSLFLSLERPRGPTTVHKKAKQKEAECVRERAREREDSIFSCYYYYYCFFNDDEDDDDE